MLDSTRCIATESDVQARLQPVVLGAGELAYTWLRCFHHAYGLRSIILAPDDVEFVSRSKFCTYSAVEGLGRADTCLSQLEELGGRLVAEGRVPLLLASDEAYGRIVAEHGDFLANWFVIPPTGDCSQGLQEACAQAEVGYLDKSDVAACGGEPYSIWCLCGEQGSLRAWTTARILVKGEGPVPGRGAESALLERRDDLAERAAALLASIGWRGFAYLEVLTDPNDGQCRFVELSPCMGRSAFAMNVGGADIARLLVEEYLLDASSQEVQVACKAGICTLVPRYVVRRSVRDKALRRRSLSLFDQGKAKNPLFYHADTLSHGFWARLLYLKQIEAFRRRIVRSAGRA